MKTLFLLQCQDLDYGIHGVPWSRDGYGRGFGVCHRGLKYMFPEVDLRKKVLRVELSTREFAGSSKVDIVIRGRYHDWMGLRRQGKRARFTFRQTVRLLTSMFPGTKSVYVRIRPARFVPENYQAPRGEL